VTDPPSAPRTDFEILSAAHEADRGLPAARRRDMMLALARTLVERTDDVVRAVDADFGGRCAHETRVADILPVVAAVRHALANLPAWMRPRRAETGLGFVPSRAAVVARPLGVVGILSPWNYPVQLALVPAVSALAAGNRLLLKASERTPRTAALLAEIVDAALGPEVARTVLGGPDVAAAVTALPLGHLVFTGNADTGRKAMAAAAANLTPVTLELGGKCPAIVFPDADLAAAARAIVRGKALNAGQTCVAPDTVLLVGHAYADFRRAAAAAWDTAFPHGPRTALVDDRAAERLDALTAGAGLDPLGLDGGGRRRALALVRGAPGRLAEEEIFGPVLPVVETDDPLAWLAGRPGSLAVYRFGGGPKAGRDLERYAVAGAIVEGGTVEHAAFDGLPFGGVGASGFGRLHGRAGFDALSNLQGVVTMAPWTPARLLDPPAGPTALRVLERLMRV
jgi:acyl-CoA reductase-like NAD-dependent aldehyde dehydrogenase